MPYGNKTKDELIGYGREILNFMRNKGVKAVVIACNTSSALAYETLKSEFNFPIFPIIQSCAEVIAKENLSKIGVFATVGTVSSGVCTKELQKYNPNLQVKEIACPDWVEIVEKGMINTQQARENVEKHMNEMMEFSPDKIILGCTHYPYLLSILENYAPRDKFIDPADIFTDYIGEHIQHNSLKNIGTEDFYVSSSPNEFVQNAKQYHFEFHNLLSYH